MLEELSKAAFSEALHSQFRLITEDGETATLELVELKDGYSVPEYEQFSILFKAPGQLILPQKTYLMEHERIGSFDLFIVPIGRGENETYYEAVFNRSIES
jgi:hypothetical protein